MKSFYFKNTELKTYFAVIYRDIFSGYQVVRFGPDVYFNWGLCKTWQEVMNLLPDYLNSMEPVPAGVDCWENYGREVLGFNGDIFTVEELALYVRQGKMKRSELQPKIVKAMQKYGLFDNPNLVLPPECHTSEEIRTFLLARGVSEENLPHKLRCTA